MDARSAARGPWFYDRLAETSDRGFICYQGSCFMLLFVSWAIVGFAALGLISGEIYTFLFGPDSEMYA